MTPDQFQQFVSILGALSPENLMADGENTMAAAARIKRSLLARWAALEAEVGRKVGEDEIWAQYMDRRPRGGVVNSRFRD